MVIEIAGEPRNYPLVSTMCAMGAQRSHQSLDRTTGHGDPLSTQLSPDLAGAVDLEVFLVDASNLRRELGIAPHPGRFSLIVKLASDGLPDEEIAAQLTAQGYRSPMRQQVLPSTIKTIRLKHGMMLKPHQSHPRRAQQLFTPTPTAADLLHHHTRRGFIVPG